MEYTAMWGVIWKRGISYLAHYRFTNYGCMGRPHRSWNPASSRCGWMDSYPRNWRGLFPCSHGDNQNSLSVDLCHLAWAIRELTSSMIVHIFKHSRTSAVLLIFKFLVRTCGDEDIAPRINLGSRWTWVVSFTSRPLYHSRGYKQVYIGWETV
jgi:hypothetical protein